MPQYDVPDDEVRLRDQQTRRHLALLIQFLSLNSFERLYNLTRMLWMAETSQMS